MKTTLEAKIALEKAKFDKKEHIRKVVYLVILATLIWSFNWSVLQEIAGFNTIVITNPALASTESNPGGNGGLEDQEGSPVDFSSHEEPSPSAIESKVCKKWGAECKIALAVMKAESQGDPRRIGDRHLTYKVGERTYGASYGLFQLRDLPGRFEDPQEMLDEDKNIEYAFAMWEKQGWRPWSAWKSGSYLNYL